MENGEESKCPQGAMPHQERKACAKVKLACQNSGDLGAPSTWQKGKAVGTESGH